MPGQLTVVEADITTLAVDAIVNAANARLMPGGGVCGAIFRAAGPGLRDACKGLGGCPTGEAKITEGYKLPARFVIHAVGPVWRGGGFGEEGLLASCYRRSLELAAENGAPRVAFPAISTGIYGFPPERAAPIAVRASREAMEALPAIAETLFCCFDASSAELHRRAIAAG